MGLPIPKLWMQKDPDGGWYPWYTETFVEELLTWDVSKLDVLEYGGGWSTVWWAKNAGSVTVIEHDLEWIADIKEELTDRKLDNVEIIHEPDMDTYPYHHGGIGKHDIICIDGSKRIQCAETALAVSKLGTRIILDNADEEGHAPIHNLLKFNVRHSFPQPRHPSWRTDYWLIERVERWDHLSFEEAHTLEVERLKKESDGIEADSTIS